MSIPDNKYVPPGNVITKQNQIDSLPERIGSPYEKTNNAVIDININLSEEYQKLSTRKLVQEREIDMEKIMMKGNQ